MGIIRFHWFIDSKIYTPLHTHIYTSHTEATLHIHTSIYTHISPQILTETYIPFHIHIPHIYTVPPHIHTPHIHIPTYTSPYTHPPIHTHPYICTTHTHTHTCLPQHTPIYKSYTHTPLQMYHAHTHVHVHMHTHFYSASSANQNAGFPRTLILIKNSFLIYFLLITVLFSPFFSQTTNESCCLCHVPTTFPSVLIHILSSVTLIPLTLIMISTTTKKTWLSLLKARVQSWRYPICKRFSEHSLPDPLVEFGIADHCLTWEDSLLFSRI